jgi:hypothetical protein
MRGHTHASKQSGSLNLCAEKRLIINTLREKSKGIFKIIPVLQACQTGVCRRPERAGLDAAIGLIQMVPGKELSE